MVECISAKVIIFDIEGTTTSIKFVKDTLFPYSLVHAKEYITSNWDKKDTQEAVKSLIQQAQIDIKNNLEGIVAISEEETSKESIIENIVNNFHIQIKNDLKCTPVKNLQGLIWEQGYQSGQLKGHLYEDVPKAFEKWASNGAKIYIYSSGSVHAQKLLFGFTEYGNLLTQITGHFDTKVGMKQDPKSYENILQEISCSANDVIFFTDIVQEAYAATTAGITSIILKRPGNGPLNDQDLASFKVIESFDQLEITIPK